MNGILTLKALFYICLALYSASLIFNAVRKLRIYKIADYLLVIMLGLFFLITLVLLGSELNLWDFLVPAIQFNLPLYGLLLFSGVIFALTLAVFRAEDPSWLWLIAALGIVLIAVLAEAWAVLPGKVAWGRSPEGLSPSILSTVVQAVGWGVFVTWTSIQILQAYRRTERSVVKQRAIYWTSALILYIGSSALFLLGRSLQGCVLLLLATIILNYLVLTYRLPDLKNLGFQIAAYTLTGITILLIYALGFLILERFFMGLPWYKPVYIGVFFSVVALIFFLPAHRMIKSILLGVIPSEKSRTLEIRSYSKTLSSILDLELLSKVTIEMICESLDVQKGTLFLVDRLEPEKDPPNWCLKAVQGSTATLPDLEFLPAHNPITKVLAEEKRPLTQSELEFIPKFQTIPENVMAWIRSLAVEALVPIHTEDEWIGLFALSQKRSGASFSDEELELLSTVADQTSVALQNARLVANMTRIDSQLRRARASKNTALDKIEQIKKSATDIISIKAHELRSPLTIVSGYSQLLADDKTLMEDDYYSELIKGIVSGSDRLQAIIENMLDTATIQPKNLNIDTTPLSLYTLIDGICQDLRGKVQARKIKLSHDSLGEIPPVYGDSAALKKVFEILINYAMTHTPSGGKITIKGRYIPPRSEVLKWEGAEIVVCDTGIGIDSEAKDRFFQEHMNPMQVDFSLLDEIAAGEEKPGEELAVVRSIIEAHNGRIWVERMMKDADHLPGSEFHVVLPLEQQSHPTQPDL
ncbi:MAG TPA: GAF domain-containing protein [Chloroflexi bacterium]|nr:GAF domain-containing protein [Chloroflexota bacterium]